MQKKFLTLMAAVAVFVASPVFAMEREETGTVPLLSVKKRFAVLDPDALLVSREINYHAKVDGGQNKFLAEKNLFAFFIPNDKAKDQKENGGTSFSHYKRKNGKIAFAFDWQNFQTYESDNHYGSNGHISPWTELKKDKGEVKNYRVLEDWEGIMVVDMKLLPSFKTEEYYIQQDLNKQSFFLREEEFIFYSAKVSKSVCRSKTLNYYGASPNLNASWNLLDKKPTPLLQREGERQGWIKKALADQ